MVASPQSGPRNDVTQQRRCVFVVSATATHRFDAVATRRRTVFPVSPRGDAKTLSITAFFLFENQLSPKNFYFLSLCSPSRLRFLPLTAENASFAGLWRPPVFVLLRQSDVAICRIDCAATPHSVASADSDVSECFRRVPFVVETLHFCVASSFARRTLRRLSRKRRKSCRTQRRPDFEKCENSQFSAVFRQ